MGNPSRKVHYLKEGERRILPTRIWCNTIILITLYATLTPLSHTDLMDTVMLLKRWLKNRLIYCSGSASFTTPKKLQLDRSFYDTLLPSVYLCYPKIQRKQYDNKLSDSRKKYYPCKQIDWLNPQQQDQNPQPF